MNTHQEISLEEIKKLAMAQRGHQVTLSQMDTSADYLDITANLLILIQNKNVTLKKLRKMIFGDTGEKLEKILGDKPSPTSKKKEKKGKGHGPRNLKNYEGDITFHSHPGLKVGDCCPNCSGRLFSLEPGRSLRIVGQPPLKEVLHEMEKLRCSTCLKIFKADLPKEVGVERSNPEANAIVVLGHYKNGLPFYRQSRFQSSMGVKLSPSVQFEMSERVLDAVVPVFKVLEKITSDANLLFIDDTPIKIQTLIKENKTCKPKRVGMFTTGVVGETAKHRISLFYSGRRHAGENLRELLKNRDPVLLPMELMCDGLSRNFPKEFQIILYLCLVHCRRHFVDCLDAFKRECQFIIKKLARVFHNEAHCKELLMTPEQRLLYHQEKSTHSMNQIRKYGKMLLKIKKFEPADPLGKALNYLEKKWLPLTAFLRIPGAPMENNIVERLLKTAIILRKNSLFYKTEFGAYVGDVLMSIIQTAENAGENPYQYLVALQKNSAEVFKNPHAWLPWNYREQLAQAA